MSDPSGARSANVEAKKLLKEVGSRADGLEKALPSLGSNLGEGEKRRREELLEGIKTEQGNLSRMAEAGVRASGFGRSSPAPASSQAQSTMPGGSSLFAPAAPQGRVFGASPVPQETAVTRPLDDRGLLQLQQTQMSTQDTQLGELSKLLQKQRKMGEEIGQEIGEQNELLDDVDREVGRVGGKMARAKRDMNKLG
jgi:regulator of vacuolar morphogenesis